MEGASYPSLLVDLEVLPSSLLYMKQCSNMRSRWLPWAHFLALPATRTGSLWQPFSGDWWLFLVANVKATKQRGIYYQYWIAHKLLGRKQLQAKSLEIMQESKYRYNLDRALSHYGPQRNWGTATRAWEIRPFDLQPSPCCLWPLVSLTQLHGCWAISGPGPLGAFHHKHASPHTWTPTPWNIKACVIISYNGSVFFIHNSTLTSTQKMGEPNSLQFVSLPRDSWSSWKSHRPIWMSFQLLFQL